MTDAKHGIILELRRLLCELGAPPLLMSIVNSYGDTLEDAEVLSLLCATSVDARPGVQLYHDAVARGLKADLLRHAHKHGYAAHPAAWTLPQCAAAREVVFGRRPRWGR
jgi:hypothetical protein